LFDSRSYSAAEVCPVRQCHVLDACHMASCKPYALLPYIQCTQGASFSVLTLSPNLVAASETALSPALCAASCRAATCVPACRHSRRMLPCEPRRVSAARVSRRKGYDSAAEGGRGRRVGGKPRSRVKRVDALVIVMTTYGLNEHGYTATARRRFHTWAAQHHATQRPASWLRF